MLKEINYFRVALPLWALLCGCASSHPTVIPNNFEVPQKKELDADIERNSQSFHNFILGELESKKDNLPNAIERLHKANALAAQPSPAISKRLATLELRAGNFEKALEESQKAVSTSPQDGEILALHAGILEALNRSTEAKNYYERAAAVDKEAIEPLLMQAALEFKEKNFQKGNALLEAAIKKSPDAVPLYLFSVRAYEEQQAFGKAAARAETAFKLSKESPDVGLELIRVLLKQRRYQDAKALCEKILKTAPDNSLVRRVLAQLLVGERRLDDALDQLSIVEKTDADPTQAQVGAALIELAKKNYPAAIQKLNVVQSKYPKDGEITITIASAYQAMGNVEKARKVADDIDSTQPQYEKAQLFIAASYRSANKLDEAIDVIEDLRSTKGFNPQLELYLASLYRDNNQKDHARLILEGLFQKQEPNDRLLFDYAVLLHETGDHDAVVRALKQAIALNSSNADALNFLAYTLCQGTPTPETLHEAKQYAHAALKIKPKDGYVLDTVAWIEFKLGALDAAKKHIQQALRSIRDDIVILEHASQIMAALGNDAAARGYCIEVKKLAPKDDEAVRAQQQCQERYDQ